MGPILAFRKDNDNSVALLPGPVFGYCYRDPDTGKTHRVNKANASQFSEEALCFYCPLPLKKLGVRDLLIYLAAQPDRDLDANEQIQAIQNTKNAARYDLKTVNIVVPGTDHSGQETMDAVSAALSVLDDMRRFCEELQRFYPGEEPRAFREAFDILEYQRLKFTDPDNRYAWRIRREYDGGFVQKGLELAKRYTEQDL